MIVSFIDIFDNAISSLLDSLCIVENDEIKIHLSGKRRAVLTKFIDILNSMSSNANEKTYIVFNNANNSFIIENVWLDKKSMADLYLSIKSYIIKNMKKLNMANSHMYEFIDLSDIEYDDCVDYVSDIFNSLGRKEKYVKLNRLLFKKTSLNEIKLNKDRLAIESYIASKISLI